jgi:hypothetical protein
MRRLKRGDSELSNPSLYKEMGIDRSNFGRLVKKPEWKAHIAQFGLIPQPLAGKVMGYAS